MSVLRDGTHWKRRFWTSKKLCGFSTLRKFHLRLRKKDCDTLATSSVQNQLDYLLVQRNATEQFCAQSAPTLRSQRLLRVVSAYSALSAPGVTLMEPRASAVPFGTDTSSNYSTGLIDWFFSVHSSISFTVPFAFRFLMHISVKYGWSIVIQ